jgi:hypothetical protein
MDVSENGHFMRFNDDFIGIYIGDLGLGLIGH